MLSKEGFNLWADGYDQTVELSEERNEYPFAGYKEILNNIYQEIMQHPESSILDIGIGTGVLAKRLYEHGHSITGLDFSDRMLALSKEKIPTGQFMQWDISNGVPNELPNSPFDFIVSTYTLHHLSDTDKIVFLKTIAHHLKPGGSILIGDIAFTSRDDLDSCRKANSHQWDDDEFYFVHDELALSLSEAFTIRYKQVSDCGGGFKLTRK